tara:strand:- start:1215 stop:1520 length:306 start_codon:yes stop_codon:yes gene_type:complete
MTKTKTYPKLSHNILDNTNAHVVYEKRDVGEIREKAEKAFNSIESVLIDDAMMNGIRDAVQEILEQNPNKDLDQYLALQMQRGALGIKDSKKILRTILFSS